MLASGVLLLISNTFHSYFVENVEGNSRIKKCKTISLSQTTINLTIPDCVFPFIYYAAFKKCDDNILIFSLDRSGALIEAAKYGWRFGFVLIMYLQHLSI